MHANLLKKLILFKYWLKSNSLLKILVGIWKECKMAVKWLNELFTIAILGSKEMILFKFYYSPNVEVKDFKFKTMC